MAISTILLQWQDNSNDETGFKIYKSTDGITFTYIDSVVAGIINYTALNILSGQDYWFRVTAYRGIGESTYVQAGPLSCTWKYRYEFGLARQQTKYLGRIPER